MSSDPVILDVLASICKDALQMFERILVAFDDKELKQHERKRWFSCARG